MRRKTSTAALLVSLVLVATQYTADARFDDGGATGRKQPLSVTEAARFAASTAQVAEPPAGSQTGQTREPAAEASANPPAVSPALGRRVSDVVAESRSSRRAQALDPKLLELAQDSTAYIDGEGQIFFVEPPLPEEAAAEEATAEAADPFTQEGIGTPTGSVFALNSRPGSTKTIYIDFDGETVSGTRWNYTGGFGKPLVLTYPSVTMPPFSRDGDPAFNATELNVIRDVWQTVAEDFAPFDINVTTQRPGPDAFSRSSANDPTYGVIAVVTTGDKTWLCSACGGVAYIDVFDESPYYGPAWVFPSAFTSTRYIANTVSHEVGHNLSLGHDGVQTGDPTTGVYYGGHGDWGPIMGATNRRYSQWSKGEYATANNPFEDDIADIGARTGFSPDESMSFETATLLPSAVPLATADQIIGANNDADFFAVDISQGYIAASVSTSFEPNLFPLLTLYNPSGTPIASDQISFARNNLPSGRYYLKVNGKELFTPSDGFSTYGSIGYFRVQVRQLQTPVLSTVSVAATGDGVITASWAASSTASPYTTTNYSIRLCETASSYCTPTISTTALSAEFNSLRAPGNYTATVTAQEVGGLSSNPIQSNPVSVLIKPLPAVIRRVRHDATTATLNIDLDPSQPFSPVNVSNVEVYLRNPAGGSWFVVASGPSGPSYIVPFSPTSGQVAVEVKVVAFTGRPTPWDSSGDSNIARVDLVRTAAPQAPGIGGGVRTTAPQVSPPSTPSVRGPAPQA